MIEKKAYFLDNKGIEQYAIIRIKPNIFIGIDTFDKNNNRTGYILMFFHPNNRLYLDTIYCYDKFRGNGIASVISDLADYILRDYQNYIIRGIFEPTQMSTDRENNIIRSELELNDRARKFYTQAGYKIIEYKDYINNPEKYPEINSHDFQLGEDISNAIVAKKIVPLEPPFYEDNGVIYHVNYKEISRKSL